MRLDLLGDIAVRDQLAADVGQHRIGDFLVAQEVEEGIVRLPPYANVDVQVVAERLDDGAAGCKRLGHDKGENAHDIVVAERQEAREHAGDSNGVAIAAGDQAILIR